MRVGDGAGGWGVPEGAVVAPPVVVAGDPEPPWDDEHEERGETVPPAQFTRCREPAVQEFDDARRVQRADQVAVDPVEVVPALEGGPRDVDDEGRQHRERHEHRHPLPVLAERRDVRSTPSCWQWDRCRAHESLVAPLGVGLDAAVGPAPSYAAADSATGEEPTPAPSRVLSWHERSPLPGRRARRPRDDDRRTARTAGGCRAPSPRSCAPTWRCGSPRASRSCRASSATTTPSCRSSRTRSSRGTT